MQKVCFWQIQSLFKWYNWIAYIKTKTKLVYLLMPWFANWICTAKYLEFKNDRVKSRRFLFESKPCIKSSLHTTQSETIYPKTPKKNCTMFSEICNNWQVMDGMNIDMFIHWLDFFSIDCSTNCSYLAWTTEIVTYDTQGNSCLIRHVSLQTSIWLDWQK